MKTVVGGMSYPKQTEALRRGVDIVVATPGRLTDLIEQRDADLVDVEIAVLDEADHMADMGFMPAVTALLDMVRPDGQRLLFSATLDGDVDTLVRRYLVDPVTHSSVPTHAPGRRRWSTTCCSSTPGDKTSVTSQIAAREGRTIMFVRTKHGADRLATQLREQASPPRPCTAASRRAPAPGRWPSSARARTPVLVATDVAARGIHVDDVGLVVHVDPPADPKDYLHRAGRTARAGESGTVVTLVLPHQEREVTKMAERAGVKASKSRVRPGDAGLVAITGSRQPSGIPVPERAARAERRPGPARPYRGQGGSRSGGSRSSTGSGPALDALTLTLLGSGRTGLRPWCGSGQGPGPLHD